MKHFKLFEEWKDEKILSFPTDGSAVKGDVIRNIDLTDSAYYQEFIKLLRETDFYAESTKLELYIDKHGVVISSPQGGLCYTYMWSGTVWIGGKDIMSKASVEIAMSPEEFVECLYSDKIISKHDFMSINAILSKYREPLARKYNI